MSVEDFVYHKCQVESLDVKWASDEVYLDDFKVSLYAKILPPLSISLTEIARDRGLEPCVLIEQILRSYITRRSIVNDTIGDTYE